MATDFNITMKQYNGVDYDVLYPKTTGEQIVSPVPIASGGTNANNAASGMNNLISALSSITPANNDLIPFKDVSGNTSGVVTIDTLATLASGKGAKIQMGSYTGTGTYGASNPCSLTFDFVPKILMMLAYKYSFSGMGGSGTNWGNITSSGSITMVIADELLPSYQVGMGFTSGSHETDSYGRLDGLTYEWYNAHSVGAQCNNNETTYYCVAIG